MNDTSQPSLLTDLDRRQNEVIAELDRLNDAIEQVLTDWTRSNDAELQTGDSHEPIVEPALPRLNVTA